MPQTATSTRVSPTPDTKQPRRQFSEAFGRSPVVSVKSIRSPARRTDAGPTAECLLLWIKQLRWFLRHRGFSEFVTEKAMTESSASPSVTCRRRKHPYPAELGVVAVRVCVQSRTAGSDAGNHLRPSDPALLASQRAPEPDTDLVEAVGAAIDLLTPRQREASP